jgi:ATP-dependent Clp protease ATP-binding subunit ClpA
MTKLSALPLDPEAREALRALLAKARRARSRRSARGAIVLLTRVAAQPGLAAHVAEGVSAALDAALYRVDTKAFVSRFIGETEKNLSQLFSKAEQSNAVLFFDEADSLFSKAGDDETPPAYLLTQDRLKSWTGFCLIATQGDIEPDAALRRLFTLVISSGSALA